MYHTIQFVASHIYTIFIRKWRRLSPYPTGFATNHYILWEVHANTCTPECSFALILFEVAIRLETSNMSLHSLQNARTKLHKIILFPTSSLQNSYKIGIINKKMCGKPTLLRFSTHIILFELCPYQSRLQSS